MLTRKACLLAGVMTAALTGAASAQDQTPSSTQTTNLDEVIVTAQRRSEALQDVPVAITAVSGENLRERGLVDMRDILATTPGATFTSNNAAEPVLSIRGISSGGEGAASDSGVLMLVDGEVISRDFMRSAPVYDVARVEVLRGPQGTTYGRNAVGGVFHVISKTPGEVAGGEITASIGDYAAYALEAAGDLPLSDRTRARAAFHFDSRDGYSEDVATGDDVDYREALAGRLTVVHDFSDAVTTTVRVHASRERHGETSPLKSFNPALPLLGEPFRPPYTEPSQDPYKVVTTPGGGHFDRDIWGITNELSAELGWARLISLTSFRHGTADFFLSSPIGYNNVDARNEADVFTQELRLEGALADDRLNWVAGVFYLDEDVKYGFDRTVLAATNFPPTYTQLRQTSSGQGFGVFGEVNWDITETLKLTVGARYSRDEKTFTVDNRAQGPVAFVFLDDPSTPLIASVEDSWGQPTGRVSLQYEPNDALMIYGAVSRGYKSGGWNSEPANVTAANTPFDEEIVLNIEGGVRSQFFDNRVRLNVTAFQMNYDDIQVPAFTANSVEVISNAAEATIRGIEIEAVARPNQYLTLTLGASSYDSEFDDYVTTDGDDLRGTSLARMPEWTLAASVTADTPVIGDAGSLRFRADYNTRSDVAHDAPVDPVYGIREGKDLLDLRVAWIPLSETWEAAAYVRNVLDEAEVQYIFPQGVLAQRLVSYGPPRTWGVSLSRTF